MNLPFFNKTTLTYIANSGVMLTCKNKKLVIDGVAPNADAPYMSVTKSTLGAMAEQKPPFNGVSLYMFTHSLNDHFDPVETVRILTTNKKAKVICTDECGELLQKAENYSQAMAERVMQLSLSPFRPVEMLVCGIPIIVFSLKYDGGTDEEVSNYAYLMELGGKTLLITGDAYPSEDNFRSAGIFDKHIDYLVAPFTFIGMSEGRQLIQKINPHKLFISHLPDEHADTVGWSAKTMKIFKKYEADMPDTEFLLRPMQSFTL